MSRLAQAARAAAGSSAFVRPSCRADAGLDRARVDEAGAERLLGAAERAPLRAHQERLAGHQRGALSPIAAQAMKPPLTTSSGLMPKNAGRQSTMSASLPGSSEPMWSAMPKVRAALIVYLAM